MALCAARIRPCHPRLHEQDQTDDEEHHPSASRRHRPRGRADADRLRCQRHRNDTYDQRLRVRRGHSKQVNDADEMFVQMMRPHHEQAIEMSDMLLAKTGISPEVTALAT